MMIENKLFWFYHNRTNEPLAINDGETHSIMINDNGDVFYFFNGVITKNPLNYELRFHRKNIKMSGPSLETMLKECIPNDCVDDNNIDCIWDGWHT